MANDDALRKLQEAAFSLHRAINKFDSQARSAQLSEEQLRLIPPDLRLSDEELRRIKRAACESLINARMTLVEVLEPYRDKLEELHGPFAEIVMAGCTATSYCELLIRLADRRWMALHYFAFLTSVSIVNLDDSDFDGMWSRYSEPAPKEHVNSQRIDNGIRQEIKWLRRDPANKGKHPKKTQPRGNAKDGTRKIDQAVRWILDNPHLADISKADLAEMLKCSASLFSDEDADRALRDARQRAGFRDGNPRVGFCTTGQQTDAEFNEDWARIDGEIDGIDFTSD